MTAIALTIATTDCSGGAGIQADLKTFSALGVYGASVAVALTAQNTQRVSGIVELAPAFVREQIDRVFEDLRVDAVKIGMLASSPIIEAVAAGLEAWRPRWVILDPVMVAKSGAKLLTDDGIATLRDRLLPRASLITPNLPEATALLGEAPISSREAMPRVAARLQNLGATNVLLKGGHLEGEESPDLLMHGGELIWLEGRRVTTRNTHGTGCTLASAIAALLARGRPLPAAVGEAKRYLEGAIAAADRLAVGHGHGPVHHFYTWWAPEGRPG